MRLYEQICDVRTVISPVIAPNASRVTDDRGAECWLDAKQRLGYPLSSIQQCLLYEFFESRERAAARLALRRIPCSTSAAYSR